MHLRSEMSSAIELNLYVGYAKTGIYDLFII